MSARAATTVGVAGLGLAGVMAGAVMISVGGAASAAATCAATTPSPTASASATATATATATASPTVSPTVSPTAAPTQGTNGGNVIDTVGQLVPLGNGQATTTGTPTPSGSASASPSGSPAATTTIAISPRRIVKGDAARITGKGSPGCQVLVYGYTRPSTTYRVIRSGVVADDGTYGFTVYPPSNTRVAAKSEGQKISSTTTVNVRFVISLKVTRVGVRTYRFEGGVGPGAAGVPVTVYRSSGSGTSKVGTASTASNGAWSLVHQFSGAGTFTFYAVASTTANNDSNRSRLVQASVH